jgi:hypothetical protein
MLETPDLTNSYHPVPKVYKAKKEPKPIQPGKKTIAWDNTRAVLKERFKKHGVTTCEAGLGGCWKNNALSFAHREKRNNLKPGELTAVILVCIPCHSILEALPHKKMAKFIDKIIATRTWK